MFPSHRSYLKVIFDLPNLLSIDAPLIAILWEWLIWRVFRAPELYEQSVVGLSVVKHDLNYPIPAVALLFCAVWLIYMGDRLLDCRKINFQRSVPRRHRFVNQWSKAFWWIWGSVLLCTAILALAYADRKLLTAGGLLMVIVSAYAWSVHYHAKLRRWLPKEIIVGVVFAIGVSLPTILANCESPLIASVTTLAATFTLNCLCVARVQQFSDMQQNIGSAMRLFPMLSTWLPVIASAHCLLVIALGFASVFPAKIAIAQTLSLIGLIAVARSASQYTCSDNGSFLGNLADFVLLSPLLFFVSGI